MSLFTLLSLTIVSTAIASSGKASFYGGNTDGGACSLTGYTLPSGVGGTALSSVFWDGSAQCGACISVSGPLGSVTVMVVDQCPGGCNSNDLDLFEDYFIKVGTKSAGIIDIAWEYIACPITTPLELKNKEGVSAYWFSMQARNVNQPVSKLETSSDGGITWELTTRKDYNYFENSSGCGSMVDVRVTAKDGSVVTINDVAVLPSTLVTAPDQFNANGSLVTESIVHMTSVSAAVVSPSETVASKKAQVHPKKSIKKTQAQWNKGLVFRGKALDQNMTVSGIQPTATGSYNPGTYATVVSSSASVSSSAVSEDWKLYAGLACNYEKAVNSALGATGSSCSSTAAIAKGSASSNSTLNSMVGAAQASSEPGKTALNASSIVPISAGSIASLGSFVGIIAVSFLALIQCL